MDQPAGDARIRGAVDRREASRLVPAVTSETAAAVGSRADPQRRRSGGAPWCPRDEGFEDPCPLIIRSRGQARNGNF